MGWRGYRQDEVGHELKLGDGSLEVHYNHTLYFYMCLKLFHNNNNNKNQTIFSTVPLNCSLLIPLGLFLSSSPPSATFPSGFRNASFLILFTYLKFSKTSGLLLLKFLNDTSLSSHHRSPLLSSQHSFSWHTLVSIHSVSRTRFLGGTKTFSLHTPLVILLLLLLAGDALFSLGSLLLLFISS